MDDRVIHALRLYFNDTIDFDSLEDRIVPIPFEAEDGGLVFEVVAEIAYVKDRVSDEGTFRERVRALVTEYQKAHAHVPSS